MAQQRDDGRIPDWTLLERALGLIAAWESIYPGRAESLDTNGGIDDFRRWLENREHDPAPDAD